MKNVRRNNENLNAIGKKLFKAAAVPQPEIDRIVSNPSLYDQVIKRIAAEQASVDTASMSWTRKVAFAGLPLAMIAAGISAGLIISDNPVSEVGMQQVPLAIADDARPEIPPQGITEMSSAGRANTNEISAVKATKRREPNTTKRNRRVERNMPDEKFYSISHTDDALTNGRIVRVDLDRTSAFALGVDLPLENGQSSIKADLLVGSDGVARAIRVVK